MYIMCNYMREKKNDFFDLVFAKFFFRTHPEIYDGYVNRRRKT